MGKNPNQRTMPEGAMTTVPVQDGNAASGIGPTGETRSQAHPGGIAAPAHALGSLLAQGLTAFEATATAPTPAPRNSAQDAEALKRWEKGQKPGPDAERESESWFYKHAHPSIYKPVGHPDRERAQKQITAVMKAKLQPLVDGFLGLPDPRVTPIQKWGEYRKKNSR
jgi:hypothetical protein